MKLDYVIDELTPGDLLPERHGKWIIDGYSFGKMKCYAREKGKPKWNKNKLDKHDENDANSEHDELLNNP